MTVTRPLQTPRVVARANSPMGLAVCMSFCGFYVEKQHHVGICLEIDPLWEIVSKRNPFRAICSGQVESSDDLMQKQKTRKVDSKKMKKECLGEN